MSRGKKFFFGVVFLIFVFLFGRCYRQEYAFISEIKLSHVGMPTIRSLFIDEEEVNRKIILLLEREMEVHELHGFAKLKFEPEKGFVLYRALRSSEWWYERFSDSYLCALEGDVWDIIEEEINRHKCMSGNDIIPSSIPLERKIFWIKRFAWSGEFEDDKFILEQVLREKDSRIKIAYLVCLRNHYSAYRIEEFVKPFLSDSEVSVRIEAESLLRWLNNFQR